jgi:hypothetical protein
MPSRINGLYLPVDENLNTVQLGYDDFSMRYAYNASGNIEYMGKATPGVLTNSVGWQLKLYEYDGSIADAVTSITYASGCRDYTFQWDQRNSGVIYL